MKFQNLKIWRIFNSLCGDLNKGEDSGIQPDSVGARMEQVWMDTLYSRVLLTLLFVLSVPFIIALLFSYFVVAFKLFIAMLVILLLLSLSD